MSNKQNVTSLSAIILILLRELRVERNLRQAQIAGSIGKTPSAWTKIEAGKSPMKLDTFISVCRCLTVQPSDVIGVAQNYAMALRGCGWSIVSTNPENTDALLREAQAYWASPGCHAHQAARPQWYTIVQTPSFGNAGRLINAPVFEFVINPRYRLEQLAAGQQFPLPALPHDHTAQGSHLLN